MFAQARQAYVAGRLAGGDMLLMAYTREDCRELSRQIRDDLVHLGLVDGGPTAQLTFGAEVSAGGQICGREEGFPAPGGGGATPAHRPTLPGGGGNTGRGPRPPGGGAQPPPRR